MIGFEKYIFLFLFGGFGYGVIEVAFRGFTHWSMVITGGTAILSLYLIHKVFPTMPIIIKSLIGCGIITTLEFTVGIIVNKIYNFSVWDYTGMPANILGQISLSFSICWFTLSMTIFAFFYFIEKLLNYKKS
ncbi:MAG: hypothetical protein IKV25_05680 [Clostridia bacterium]|nr:hypothetical protein [Clostridia bacterium]